MCSIRMVFLDAMAKMDALALSEGAESVKRVIMTVALVAMVTGMWFLRDLVLMPIDKIPGKEDLKPRMIVGILMVFCAVCAIAKSSVLAEFIANLWA